MRMSPRLAVLIALLTAGAGLAAGAGVVAVPSLRAERPVVPTVELAVVPAAKPTTGPAAGPAAGFATLPAAGSAPAAPPAGSPAAAPPAYGWPLPGAPPVARRFEPPAHRFGPGHRGVDLAGTPGEPVLAAGDGVVVFAGPLAGRGVVSVDHAGGLRTTYEPVTAAVAPGQRVRRGDLLGVLEPGHAGCPAAACLHWGARRGAVYVDPLLLLGRHRVRLLPWDAGP